jgi:dolichol-phosphate mannosyltransferase
MKQKKLLSIVVPVFNESEVIEVFYQRTKSVADSLDSFTYEIIFVDDGSRDDSYDKMVRLANSDPKVKILKFSRNFGHQIAITAGTDMAKGDAVVVIDADLQDPPEVIRNFIAKLEEGYDVVYGVREKREGEGKMKLFTASLFYRMLKALTKVDIPVDTGDFRLMSKRAVAHLRELREQDRFVRGLVSWIGFKQTAVSYRREKRFAGETKYPYKKMIKFALDGLTSFSSVPLKLATMLGYATSFLALLYAGSVFVQKLLGITVQGWATIMVGMLFLGGVQLICIGIMGEYIARIFNQTKQRPMYIVEEIYTSAKTRDVKTSPHESFSELLLTNRLKSLG